MGDKHENVIVVGVDSSPEALTAARYAVDEAQRRHLDVRLVHAYGLTPIDVPYTDSGVNADERRESQALMEWIVNDLAPPATVSVETRLELAATVPALEHAAATARLLVVGHHEASWGERLLSGSVASALSARASCPVVTVPGRWHPVSTSKQPVIVALDGETSARSALKRAFEQADLMETDLVALHAAPTSATPLELQEHEVTVAEVLAGWRELYPSVTVRTKALPGEADDAIVDASHRAAILVVGRPHTNRSLTRWTRSVGRRVLMRTRCPLMVVPQDPADIGRAPAGNGLDLLIPTY